MKLDTTKVYYLGDLSDEQLDILLNDLGFKTWSKGKKRFLFLVDNKWCVSDLMYGMSDSIINALTLFTQKINYDIILDEKTYYNLDGISKEQYEELQNEYNNYEKFCIIDLPNPSNEKLDDNLCLGKFSKEWMVFYTTKKNKKEFKNITDLFNNRRIAFIQLRIQELNNELIELDEEMRKLTYDN